MLDGANGHTNPIQCTESRVGYGAWLSMAGLRPSPIQLSGFACHVPAQSGVQGSAIWQEDSKGSRNLAVAAWISVAPRMILLCQKIWNSVERSWWHPEPDTREYWAPTNTHKMGVQEPEPEPLPRSIQKSTESTFNVKFIHYKLGNLFF